MTGTLTFGNIYYRILTNMKIAMIIGGDCPEGMPLWGPNRFWPGSGLVLRCLGPGFTVLALGPGFRPIIIIIIGGDLPAWT